MILKCLSSALKSDGHDVATVAAGDLALKLVGFTTFDIIITDYSMPRMDGIKFLEIARERSPGIPVIMITGYGTPETEREAKSKGAFDYLTKPFSLDTLRTSVVNAENYVKARKNVSDLINPNPKFIPYPQIVAGSALMVEVCRKIEALCMTNLPVLFRGERGAGKELLARTIHANNNSKLLPFEKVDCSKWRGDETVGSILGRIKTGGVLFHDIESMPPAAQAELAQILQSGRYTARAGMTPSNLNVRVFSSTIADVEALVKEGRFDGSLWTQFAENTLSIPALRERPEDIRIYIGLTLRNLSTKAGDVAPIELEALEILERYSWPGNLPELEDALRNALTMSKGRQIGLMHLPQEILAKVKAANGNVRTSSETVSSQIVQNAP